MKMKLAEMVERIERIEIGTKLSFSFYPGKVFEVKSVRRDGGKYRTTDISVLEEGKPETYEQAGRFLAAGKIFTCSNLHHFTLYANNSSCSIWDIVE